MREGWVYKKLNEVCDKGSSNIVINKLTDNNGDYPLYGASGLVKNVDFYHQDKEYIGIVKDGAGVGRVNTYPAYSSLVGTMQYIFPKEECLLNYIKYFLVKLDLSHCVSGATIPHIYFKDYGKELIPVPTLKEQQSIVSELDKINELIRLKEEQLSDYDKLAQSIFYEMFGDPVENEKGWEVKKLGEFSEVVRGGSPRPIDNYLGGDYPWIKIGDATKGNGIYLESTKEYIIKEGINKTRYIPQGSMIFANCGVSLGFARIITFAGCIHDGWLAFMNIDEDIVNKIFFLKSLNVCTPYFRSLAPEGTQPNLNTKIMRCFHQILPPLPLQQLFAQRIELIEQQKAEIKSTISDLETLLASRMQYWFE